MNMLKKHARRMICAVVLILIIAGNGMCSLASYDKISEGAETEESSLQDQQESGPGDSPDFSDLDDYDDWNIIFGDDVETYNIETPDLREVINGLVFEQVDKVGDKEETLKAIVMGMYIVDMLQRGSDRTMKEHSVADLVTFSMFKDFINEMKYEYMIKKLGTECEVTLSDDVCLLVNLHDDVIEGVSLCINGIKNANMRPLRIECTY